jgi:hypothetical protein
MAARATNNPTARTAATPNANGTRAVVSLLVRRRIQTFVAHLRPDHQASAEMAGRAGLEPNRRVPMTTASGSGVSDVAEGPRAVARRDKGRGAVMGEGRMRAIVVEAAGGPGVLRVRELTARLRPRWEADQGRTGQASTSPTSGEGGSDGAARLSRCQSTPDSRSGPARDRISPKSGLDDIDVWHAPRHPRSRRIEAMSRSGRQDWRKE